MAPGEETGTSRDDGSGAGAVVLLLRTARPQIAFATLLPLVAGMASAEPASPTQAHAVPLLACGFGLHCYWWWVNNLADARRDQAHQGGSPAANEGGQLGAATAAQRRLVARTAAAVAVIVVIGAGAIGDGVTAALMALCLAAQHYVNWQQKNPARHLPTGPMDIASGIAFGLPVMVGAHAVGGRVGPSHAWLVLATAAFIFVLNSARGNLKDLEADTRSGARTLAIAMGARFDGTTGLRVPRSFLLALGVGQGVLTAALIGYAAPIDDRRPWTLVLLMVAGAAGLEALRRTTRAGGRLPAGVPVHFVANVWAFMAVITIELPVVGAIRAWGTMLALLVVGVALARLGGAPLGQTLRSPWPGPGRVLSPRSGTAVPTPGSA
jgi:4-hydroxybenzoate polyprenyltransferase